MDDFEREDNNAIICPECGGRQVIYLYDVRGNVDAGEFCPKCFPSKDLPFIHLDTKTEYKKVKK